jgi:hypothetical protein
LIAVIRIHWGAWGMGRGEWGVGNGACSIWLPYTLFSPPPGLPPLGGGTERDSLPPLTPGERSRKWCTQSLSLFGNVGSACRRRARCRYHSLTRQPRTCSRYGVRQPCCRINHAHRSQLWGSAPCSSRTPYFRPPPGLPPLGGETERDSLPPLTPGERSRKWCTPSLSLFGNVGSACRRRARCRYHSLTRQPRTCSRYGVRQPCCRTNHAHRYQLWGSAPGSSRTPYFRPPPGLPPLGGGTERDSQHSR